MFKVPVLPALYNLGDDNAEYLIRNQVPGAKNGPAEPGGAAGNRRDRDGFC